MLYDQKQVEIYISGLFVSCSSIGEILGPVMSSNLAHYYNFRTAQEVYATLLLIFIILYFLLAGNFAMFGAATPVPVSEEDENA